MTTLLLMAAYVVALSGALWFVAGVIAWFCGGRPPRLLRPLVRRVESLLARWPGRPSRRRDPLPSVLLELELRRLAEGLQRAADSRQPATAERLQAWTGAYDLALVDYCGSLGLVPPGCRAPLTARERFDLESRLIGAGYDW